MKRNIKRLIFVFVSLLFTMLITACTNNDDCGCVDPEEVVNHCVELDFTLSNLVVAFN